MDFDIEALLEAPFKQTQDLLIIPIASSQQPKSPKSPISHQDSTAVTDTSFDNNPENIHKRRRSRSPRRKHSRDRRNSRDRKHSSRRHRSRSSGRRRRRSSKHEEDSSKPKEELSSKSIDSKDSKDSKDSGADSPTRKERHRSSRHRHRDRDEHRSSRHRERSYERSLRYDDRRDYDRHSRHDEYDRTVENSRYRDDYRSSRYRDEPRNEREPYNRSESDRRRKDKHVSNIQETDDFDPLDDKPLEDLSDFEKDKPAPILSTYERDRRTVFVKQLAARLKVRELIDFFTKAGKVRDAKIVTDKHSGRSKGIGYVEFIDVESVSNAIALTDTKLLGIPVIVEITESEKNRRVDMMMTSTPDAVLTQPVKPSQPKFTRLYVANLHSSITDDHLRKIFEPFGPLDFANIQRDDGNRSKGFAYVQYKRSTDASTALDDMKNYELMGKMLRVSSVLDKGGLSSLSAMGSNLLTTKSSRDDRIHPSRERNHDRSDYDRNAPPSRIREYDSSDRGRGREDYTRRDYGAPPPREKPNDKSAREAVKPSINLNISTRCLLLTNMFDPEEETAAHWEKEIEEDVGMECSKFGTVLHIAVDKDSPGHVYLKFSSLQGSEAAIKALNGRFFAGKTISAKSVPDAVYNSQFPAAAKL